MYNKNGRLERELEPHQAPDDATHSLKDKKNAIPLGNSRPFAWWTVEMMTALGWFSSVGGGCGMPKKTGGHRAGE